MQELNKQTKSFIEPILDPKNVRFTIKPIDPKYDALWKFALLQRASNWVPAEIDYSKDYNDFELLTKDEQKFIKMVLAFFAASDGIVNFNLNERFGREIQIMEAKVAYGEQIRMENIHGEVYSDMLINIVKDPVERDFLFNAIKTVPTVKKMADWALKWIESNKSIGHRIIAFCVVEGIFFSGAFAAIFWLRKQRGTGKQFMKGLMDSNDFIARDEGMHVNFGCTLYSYIVERVNPKEAIDIITEANEISKEFINNAIKCKMIGMNNDLMNQYINYVSDRLLISLGYDKLYNCTNPFDFMETIGFLAKTNFFESRPNTYQSSHNEQNKNWEFEIKEEF